MKKLPPKKCRKDSKEDKIRKCLLAYQSLTPLEALRYFGHMRLADVVLDLRREGVNIKNLNEKFPNKHAIYQRR
jgi:hypothetical protein